MNSIKQDLLLIKRKINQNNQSIFENNYKKSNSSLYNNNNKKHFRSVSVQNIYSKKLFHLPSPQGTPPPKKNLKNSNSCKSINNKSSLNFQNPLFYKHFTRFKYAYF